MEGASVNGLSSDHPGLYSPVNNVLGMQIVHALCHLPSNVDKGVELELGLTDVHVLVETAALAPLRDNGQRWLRHAAHEEQYVAVSRLLQHSHLILECLQLGGTGRLHLQRLDRN